MITREKVKRLCTWFLCGVALLCLSYSVVAFTSSPAYAAACGPHCPLIEEEETTFCKAGHGGLAVFECPVSGNPDYFFFECKDGYNGQVYCEN